MQVFVIRHTTPNVGKDICYGQTDVGLADSFVSEATLLKNKLPASFDAVYCSTLQRCKTLAKELQYAPITYDSRLIEYNFGDWENKKWNDIPQTELNIWMEDYVNIATPNGENVQALFNRLTLFLDDMRSKNVENVLLITHSGIIRCIWVYLLQMPLQNMFKVPVGFGEVLAFNLGTSRSFDTIIQKM